MASEAAHYGFLLHPPAARLALAAGILLKAGRAMIFLGLLVIGLVVRCIGLLVFGPRRADRYEVWKAWKQDASK